MIIDLRALDDDGGHLEAEQELRFEDAFGEKATVRCQVGIDYRRTGAASYLSGTLHGDYHTRCHRCLESVEVPVDGEFRTVIRRRGKHDAEEEQTEDPEYIVVAMGEHTVDLGTVIHENFVINVPMMIVCREECRGLCPTCGINFNHQTCACTATADPRWDALRDLGDQQSGE